MNRAQKSRSLGLSRVAFCVAAALCAGCTNLARDLATHLAQQNVKAVEEDFTVIEGNLAVFRQCLAERGGSCPAGDPSAPLPHSSQHRASAPIAATDPGGSQTLADSVARLPAGHPAKIAHEVLGDPVTRQAAALHDHLRGHSSGSTPGVTVEVSRDGSTVAMDLKLGQIRHLHHRLLSSLGTGAWDALDAHCQNLLQAHPGDTLFAECRRIAFVRGYLGAYLRHGELLEVKVGLAGGIRAVNDEARKIESRIDSVIQRIDQLVGDVKAAKEKPLQALADDAQKAVADAAALLTRRTEGAEITAVLEQAETAAGQLSAAAEADIAAAANVLRAALGQVKTQIGRLAAEVVQIAEDGLGQANEALSNVFKVSRIGFASRDATFLARLPTVEVTLDPTAKRLLTVVDADTGQFLTTRSQLADLGVATDASSVGTGAELGAEIVHVFLEAVFDAQEGLPAVAPANMPDVKPTGLTLGAYSLPLFQTPTGNVDANDFTTMTNLNDAAALKVRLVVGRILSGAGPFSLNSPPLESFITEIVATSVRKAVEKASWCWYACNLDGNVKRLASDVDKTVKDELSAEQKRAHAEHVAAREKLGREIVKLRIKLSE